MSIYGAQKYRVAEECKPLVYLAATDPDVTGDGAAIDPKRASCARVECRGMTRRLGNVHDAIDHNWRGLKRIQILNLVEPGRFQALNVLCRDLSQRREAMSLCVSGVGEPVGWLAGRQAKPGGTDLSGTPRSQREKQEN